MLPKYRKKSYILDKLHHGFVKICMGVTVIGGVTLGYKIYVYFRYIKPALREIQMQNNNDLLEEGRYKPIVG